MTIKTIQIPVATIAALLLNRFSPMAPHHVSALREAICDLTDEELREVVVTGKMEVVA